MKMHELNTTGWNEFPFEANGVKYVSRVSPESSFMRQIPFLPEGVFESMNASAVLELIGQGLSREQIISELYSINAGASHAVVELVVE